MIPLRSIGEFEKGAGLMATLSASVQAELDRVSQTLTARMRELAERYGTPLPQIEADLAELEKKVAGHLAKMGFAF